LSAVFRHAAINELHMHVPYTSVVAVGDTNQLQYLATAYASAPGRGWGQPGPPHFFGLRGPVLLVPHHFSGMLAIRWYRKCENSMGRPK